MENLHSENKEQLRPDSAERRDALDEKLMNRWEERVQDLSLEVEGPFCHPKTLKALGSLALQLRGNFEKYDSILSDDISGRLVSLFLRKISEKDLGRALPGFFVPGGFKIEIREDAIKEFLKKKADSMRHPLVVTEYIQSGNSMSKLLRILEESGMDADVAAVSAHGQGDVPDNVREALKYIGDESGTAGLRFWSMGQSAAGVSKKEQAHGEDKDELFKNTDEISKQKVKRAREDLSKIADAFWEIVREQDNQ